MSDPVLNVGEPEGVKERGKRISLAQRKRNDVVRAVWGTREGRAFAWGILCDSGVFRTPFVPSDPHATSFNAGAQNLGLKLLGEVHEVCPEFYLMAMEEAKPKKEDEGNA